MCTHFVKYGVVCHVALSGLIGFVIYSALKVFAFSSFSSRPHSVQTGQNPAKSISRRGARARSGPSIPPPQSLTGALFINAQPK